MSIRLKLSVLTMFAGLAAFSGCGDDSDGDDPAKGGEAGEASSPTGGKSSTGGSTSSTGGKASTGGTSSDGGSTDPGEGGDTSTGGTSPGGGGAPGEAGAPSEGGDTSTGSGGAPAGTCEYPQCLADLQANCVPEGECTAKTNFDISNPDPSNITFNMCWENGVKAGLTDIDAGSSSGTFEYQKDGATCYSVRFTGEPGGDSSGTFLDANGDEVATMVTDADTQSQTITCLDSGQVVVYTPSSCPEPDPGSEQPDPLDCTMGECALD